MHVEAVSNTTPPVGEAGVVGRNAGPGSGGFRDVLAESQQLLTVRSGDTLSDLVAERLRGTGQVVSRSTIYDGVDRVALANGLRDPDFIRIGQRLDLSALGSTVAAHRTPAVSSPLVPTARTTPEVSPTAVPIVPRRNVVVSSPPPSRSSAPLPAPTPPMFSSKNTAGALVQPIIETASLTPTVARVESPPAPTAPSPWRSIVHGPARLTSEFGLRRDPFNGDLREHHGIDLAARRGSRVFAPSAGQVVFSGWKGNYGNVVVVSHADGSETRYGHNEQNLVSAGDWVTPSTPLAAVGSTGRSTATHLHFEVRRGGEVIDPVPYLAGETGALFKASL